LTQGIVSTLTATTVEVMTTSSLTLWGIFTVALARLTRFASLRISTDASDIRTVMTQAKGCLTGVLLEILEEIPMPSPQQKDPTAAWAEAGGTPIRRRDLAPRASQPNKVVAWVWERDGHVLALITASGDTPDLPPLGEDRTNTLRNAYTEFVCEGLALGRPEVWDAIRADRWTRDFGFGHKMLAIAKLVGTKVVWDGVEKDLSQVSGMITASVDVSVSDKKLDDLRGSWHNGRVAKLQAGERDISFQVMPLGYEPRLVPGAMRGSLVPEPGSVEPNAARASALQTLAEAVAHPAMTWIEIGKLGHRLGVVAINDTRSTRRTGENVDSTNYINWARRLFSPTKIHLYRTGVYATVRHTKAVTVTGHDLIDEGDHRSEAVDSSWGLPTLPGADHPGWGVPSATWVAILDRLECGSREGAAMRCRIPLSGVDKWVDGSMRYHLRPDRRRLVLQAYPADKRWHRDNATTVGAVSRQIAVSGIGKTLADALHSLAAQQGRLRVTGTPPELAALRAKRAEFEIRRAELAADAEAEGKLARTSMKSGDDDDAAHHSEQAAGFRRQAADLLDEIGNLDRHVAEVAVATAGTVDLGFPAEVAGRMQSWKDGDDLALIEALDELGIHRTFRVQVLGDRMRWSAVALIPLLDGTNAELPLTGSWQLTPNGNAFSPEDLIDDWAGGASAANLADKWDRTAAGMTKSLVEALKGQFPSTSASVLATCPALEVRAAVIADVNTEVWARHTAEVYRRGLPGQPRDWAAERQTRCRTVLLALLAAGGHALPRDLVDSTGLALWEVNLVASRTTGRPALVSRHNGVFSLIRCPHCPGWASHYLITPETRELPLICPACRRQPELELAERIWPVVYLEPWDAIRVDGSLVSTIVPVPSLLRPPIAFDGRIVNTEEAGQTLGVNAVTVRRWSDEGRLKEVPGPGSSRWFLREEVEKLAARRHHVGDIGRHKPLAGLLSPRAAAIEIGCSIDLARKLCQRGELEWVPVQHGKLTIKGISPASVASYIEERKRAV
jgi:hypothetical protein